MALRVLTWNLMHGRSVPSAGEDLEAEFAAALDAWRWDVALLQEVPPWWPAALGARLRADHRLVLTSRNALLGARRAIATRWPDLIKSNGGGANAILVRRGEIVEHRALRLSLLPERRWLQAVRVAGGDHFDAAIWIANVHLTGGDAPEALREAGAAASAVLGWAAGEPAVLGGDFNVPAMSLQGFAPAGGNQVDHVLVSGFEVVRPSEVLERGGLSDHAPVAVELLAASAP